MKLTRAAGATMRMLARNFSSMRHPGVRVAAMVVSEINDRLSPKKAPPITAATYMAVGAPAAPAISAARGARATTVPTEVPTDSDMKHAARNMPGNSICGGNTRSVSATVASTAPISLAIEAKAPASTKIQIM